MRKKEKLWALLGLLFLILINYPFLSIFNREILVLGVPLLPLYLFGVWTLAVVALFTLGRWLKRPK